MRDVAAFNSDQVSALAGLSERQLASWDRLGLFPPSYSERSDSGRTTRLYSFRDLVGLRLLALLRNTHGIPLQQLRKIHAYLRQHFEDPWSQITFYVLGHTVCFDDPRTGTRVDGKVLGQAIFTEIPMKRVEREMRAAANQLRERTPDEIGAIAQYRSVMNHAPVVAGTRIPTAAVWRFHQAGYGPEAIIEQYPSLTLEDVAQAIAYEQRRRTRAG